MEKLFKSKIAFVVFAILFSAFLFITYKDPFARFMWGLSMGGFIGFIFAQWYWIEKMKKIQHLLDDRMMSPTTELLLKDKEDELFKAANENTKLVDRIGELQNEIALLKESYNTVLAEMEHLADLYLKRVSSKEAAPIQEPKEKGE
jgi:hypothetical protein